jgi:protein-tyrosine phosphatase
MYQPMSILFMCLGNHCRSPAAEAVAKVVASGTGFAFSSAGTNREHLGQGAHRFTVEEGERRGYALALHRGRRIEDSDFGNHALIVCMDQSNIANVERIRQGRDLRAPQVRSALPEHIMLLRAWDTQHKGADLEDPWGGPVADYKRMYDTIERCVPALVQHLLAALPSA